MRKTQKLVDKLLAELERTGIPLTACSKVGVGRSTYYRWRQDSITFKLQADEAIRIGRENITDLAESKLVKNISDGNQRAIEFQLRHNDSRYRYFNQIAFAKMLEDQSREVEPESSPIRTVIDIVFDSIEVSLVEEYSTGIPDDYTMQIIEVESKKDGAIRYLQRLIEEKAAERLKNITPPTVADEDT